MNVASGRSCCSIFWFCSNAAFVEGVFTMTSAGVKNPPLEEQFPPNVVRRCHKARDIPRFNVFIRKDDNALQATIDLVIESVGLPNYFLHHTEPSEVKSKLPIRNEWA